MRYTAKRLGYATEFEVHDCGLMLGCIYVFVAALRGGRTFTLEIDRNVVDKYGEQKIDQEKQAWFERMGLTDVVAVDGRR